MRSLRSKCAHRCEVSRTDPHAADKALWVRTKRFVLAHIKVQPGADLLESLLAEVGTDDEDAWAYIAQTEIEAARRADQRHGSRTSPKMSHASDSADDEIYACVLAGCCLAPR